ncbi:MAG: beta-lactamase family protein [Clostridia bacterium]|nr:beta-lactamase family protein [Clostridia bacterium]
MNYFEKTERLIQNGIDTCVFPGAAYAVGDKNGIYLNDFKGYSRTIMNEDEPNGVFCGKIPPNASLLTRDTLFDMASLTKILSTTTVCLRMIEDGMICLDDTIGRFFSVPNDKKDIQIRHLMTHSSGIHPHFALYDMCSSPEQVLDTIISQPLFYKTSERVEYSCMGYIVLGKILETVSGESLDSLAERYVFSPLGMSSTGYCPDRNPKLKNKECVCEEYSHHSKKYIQGVVHDENARFMGGVSGNAGVFSCIDDVCKFALMLSRFGVYENEQFLTPSILKKAIYNYTKDIPGQDRGLGFYLSSGIYDPCGDLFALGSFGHLGFTGNSLFVDKDTGMFAVLLTNRVHYTRGNDKILRFRRLFHNCAMAEYTRMIHD